MIVSSGNQPCQCLVKNQHFGDFHLEHHVQCVISHDVEDNNLRNVDFELDFNKTDCLRRF